MSGIYEAWMFKRWFVGELKIFKLLADISFASDFKKTVLSSLVLFLCGCF